MKRAKEKLRGGINIMSKKITPYIIVGAVVGGAIGIPFLGHFVGGIVGAAAIGFLGMWLGDELPGFLDILALPLGIIGAILGFLIVFGLVDVLYLNVFWWYATTTIMAIYAIIGGAIGGTIGGIKERNKNKYTSSTNTRNTRFPHHNAEWQKRIDETRDAFKHFK